MTRRHLLFSTGELPLNVENGCYEALGAAQRHGARKTLIDFTRLSFFESVMSNYPKKSRSTSGDAQLASIQINCMSFHSDPLKNQEVLTGVMIINLECRFMRLNF